MLPYLVCKNLVVRIIAPNIIQELNNRVEVASLFSSRGEKYFITFERRISANAMSNSQCFTDFTTLIKIRSRNVRYLFTELFFQL